jgi:cysteine-rich CPXCG protein
VRNAEDDESETSRLDLSCPHCGEPLDANVDPGGGERQDYVEDCAVCCRPIRFVAVQDAESGEYFVEVWSEI